MMTSLMTSLCRKQYKSASVRLYGVCTPVRTVCTSVRATVRGGARLEDIKDIRIRAGLQPSVSHREEPSEPQTPLTHYVNQHFMLL